MIKSKIEILENLSDFQFKICLILVVFLLIHLFSAPAYFALNPNCKPCPECCDMQAKIDRKENLFFSVQDKYLPHTHMAKQEFRLTPPLLFKIFNINTKYGAYALQLMFGFIFFLSVIILFSSMTSNRLLISLLTLSIGFIYSGYTFVAEMEGFFDSFAFMFLVICMLDLPLLVMLIASFLAFYTDERAILSSLLIIVWWQTKQSFVNKKAFLIPSVQSLILVASIFLYFITRYFLINNLGFKNQFAGINCLPSTFNSLGLTFWQMFEGFWVFVSLALYVLIKDKRFVIAFIWCTATLLVFIAGHFVMDLSRSVAYTFPSIFIAVLIVFNSEFKDSLKPYLISCLIVCFIFPAQNVIVGKPIHYYKPIYIRLVGKILNIP